MNRLKEKYLNEVVSSLKEKYNYKSVMEVPKLEKIVINMGVGDATQNSKLLEAAVADLAKIAGQKPVVTKAKKSIAGFKVREGQAIGCKVTLRGDNMYNFMDKLISVSLPGVRDFRGVSNKSFDGRGNYTMGIKDELLIPENASIESRETLTNILNEVKYLRQEVDFLKKIVKAENTALRKY